MGWIKITDLKTGKTLKTYGDKIENDVHLSTWTDEEDNARSELDFFNHPIELTNESSQEKTKLKE